MNNTNVTEQQIVEVKNIREKYIENIEVLNKVKKLFLIPEMEVMTTKMVADYYDVSQDVIRMCYLTNKDEINSDGVIKRKISDFELNFVENKIINENNLIHGNNQILLAGLEMHDLNNPVSHSVGNNLKLNSKNINHEKIINEASKLIYAHKKFQENASQLF